MSPPGTEGRAPAQRDSNPGVSLSPLNSQTLGHVLSRPCSQTQAHLFPDHWPLLGVADLLIFPPVIQWGYK